MARCIFIFFGDKDINSVTIEIDGVDNGYADYFRLFIKYKHPSFCIIAQFEGNADEDALALGTGSEDEEIVEPRYSNFGYYDGAFLTGVASGFAQDLYEDLINYVKAQGVKAYIEIINKDYIEEE